VNTERRLVIVVRADPVICGHSGEARNLAEAAPAVELRARQPGAVEALAVEVDGLDVLDRAARCRLGEP